MNNKNIEKINADRENILKLIKENIENNNEKVTDNIDSILSIISNDEENLKQYKSISKAKELIASLTVQICNATTEEDIKKLRNKLNYYMNKVKKEMEKREISEETFNTYYNNISIIRNNISEYIRFVKRENNIKQLWELINKDELTEEETNKLKNCITKEKRFNSRLLKKYNGSNIEIKPKKVSKPKKEISKQEIINDEKNLNIKLNPKSDKQGFADMKIDLKNSTNLNNIEIKTDDEKKLERVKGVQEQCSKYNLIKINTYNKGLFGNMKAFLNNIPKYIYNKNIIKIMKRKRSENYYSKQELKDAIRYASFDNSIMIALKIIFNKSNLKKHEDECISQHSECMDAIYKFFYNDKIMQKTVQL